MPLYLLNQELSAVGRIVFSILFMCGLLIVSPSARSQPLFGRFTVHDLFRTIEEQNIHRADDLLPALPPHMRGHFTLFFRSRNHSQAYSFQFPRMVLADRGLDHEGSKLWLAMAGDPNGAGYHTAEVIAAEQNTLPNGAVEHHYDFYTIEFSPTGYVPPIISARNPVLCNDCHHGRLVWDGAMLDPHWVGAYGGARQTIAPELVAYEEAMFRKYFIDQAPQGRYRHLLGLENMTPYRPRGAGGGNPGQASLEELTLSVESAMSWSAAQYALTQLRRQPSFAFARVAILANLVLGQNFQLHVSPQDQINIIHSLLPEGAAARVSSLPAIDELRRAQLRKINRYFRSLQEGCPTNSSCLERLQEHWTSDPVRERLAVGWQMIFQFLGVQEGAELVAASGREKNTYDFLATFSDKVAAALLADLDLNHFDLIDDLFERGLPGSIVLRASDLKVVVEQFRTLAKADHLIACERRVE